MQEHHTILAAMTPIHSLGIQMIGSIGKFGFVRTIKDIIQRQKVP